MENYLDYDNLNERLSNAKENVTLRDKEAIRKRNIAAMVDFASNLLSVVAYNKGSRYTFGTSLMSKYSPPYLPEKEKTRKVINDYNGRFTTKKMLDKIRKSGITTQKGLLSPASIENNTSKTKRDLLTGSFEEAFRDYKKIYN